MGSRLRAQPDSCARSGSWTRTTASRARFSLRSRRVSCSTGRGGGLSSSPEHLERLLTALRRASAGPQEALEAILGETREISIHDVLGLLDVARVVGQVVNRYQFEKRIPTGGTGFLIDGGALREDWRGRTLLLTNHHVLSKDGADGSVAGADADVLFQFWNGTRSVRRFRVGEIVATSPRADCDFALAALEGDRAELTEHHPVLEMGANALGPRGSKPKARIYVVGHPRGRGLEFSLTDNEVLDHELATGGVPRRRIHYRAPTEEGMSGSPVLDAQRLRVVGLHRSSTRSPLLATDGPAGYRANEAIWIGSVKEACLRVPNS